MGPLVVGVGIAVGVFNPFLCRAFLGLAMQGERKHWGFLSCFRHVIQQRIEMKLKIEHFLQMYICHESTKSYLQATDVCVQW